MPGAYNAIEAAFAARRNRAPGLAHAFREAVGHLTCGPAPPAAEASLLNAGSTLALIIDQAAPSVEPAYHNRHHMAEATLAMAMLCNAAMAQGLLSRQDALLGVIAMVGHDMHHDGTCTPPGVLEARSRRAVELILTEAGAPPHRVQAIGDVITATCPNLVAVNSARAQREGTGHGLLPMLANEADVFASVLPLLGLRLSTLLATEWRAAGRPDLLPAGVAAGRASFLQAYPPFSPAAAALGLEDARAASLAVLRPGGSRRRPKHRQPPPHLATRSTVEHKPA